MVRYITMKRITQILASVLFVITVLTVYLAFDFAISNAVSRKTSSHKRSLHEHDHNHPHEEIKITRRRSITPPILHHTRKFNQTKYHDESEDHNENNDRRLQAGKQQLRPKPGSFHKGKTGVKVNKPEKSFKEKQKRLSTSTTHPQHRDKHNLADNRHV
jgi:hypothetical protein